MTAIFTAALQAEIGVSIPAGGRERRQPQRPREDRQAPTSAQAGGRRSHLMLFQIGGNVNADAALPEPEGIEAVQDRPPADLMTSQVAKQREIGDRGRLVLLVRVAVR